ncbi:alpha/beta hydrolase [Neoroseomonas soli]|uniref:Alpha/beta hydrolase n=1 Tax=Neoroseomonas soli TaxID=1081025 RepID=A0A9X9WXI2_9PROT|nr:alpha/beta fold hydrolase [Neoroseomonas soli]MBR0671861.1 alpha/beta hydrolase [Neoroseomonas soli]
MRRVLTTLAVLAVAPLIVVGLLWAGQERMIFIPDRRAFATPPGWVRGTLRTEDGLDLAFLAVPPAPGAPVLLHFHGNGGNVEHRTTLGAYLNRGGYGVVLAEYRGYGGNPGRPGEEAFARDAAAYLAWTRARFPDSALVLWGESLGSGVVARLAENRDGIAALVLESPFTSVADLARGIYPFLPTDMLLRHRFETLSRLPAIRAPVLVVGSERDGVTPAGHARRVAEAARDARLEMLPGTAHPAVLNDEDGRGAQAVLAFLARRVGR